MSEKNFMAYGDAESVFTGYANRIKQSPTTFVGTRAQWDALSLSQKAEYTLVDITDDEFSPNNFVDWESYSILGAKNLLPVTMASQVLSGVTFTVDSASGIIGVSGNNSGTPFSDVIGTTLLKPGTYKVTTGQATELNAQIGIAVTNASSGTILARSWNGTEVFTISSDTQVNFHIEVNVTGMITSTTIYPTCKLASIKDATYVPYSKTNSELTVGLSNLADIQRVTMNMHSGETGSASYVKYGKLVLLKLAYYRDTWVQNTEYYPYNSLVPIPYNDAPVLFSNIPTLSQDNRVTVEIKANGTVSLKTPLTTVNYEWIDSWVQYICK